jgi:hypothetical protein
MVDVQVATLDGQGSMLSVTTVEELKQRLRGQLIAPGDDNYDAARQVWNTNIVRRSGLICRPTGVAVPAPPTDELHRLAALAYGSQ